MTHQIPPVVGTSFTFASLRETKRVAEKRRGATQRHRTCANAALDWISYNPFCNTCVSREINDIRKVNRVRRTRKMFQQFKEDISLHA